MISHIRKQNETRRNILIQDSFSSTMMGIARIDTTTHSSTRAEESCQTRMLSSSSSTFADANSFGAQIERTLLEAGTNVNIMFHRHGTSSDNTLSRSSISRGRDDRLARTNSNNTVLSTSTPSSRRTTSKRRRLNPNHDESAIHLVRSIQIDDKKEFQDLMKMINDIISS